MKVKAIQTVIKVYSFSNVYYYTKFERNWSVNVWKQSNIIFSLQNQIKSVLSPEISIKQYNKIVAFFFPDQ